MELTMLELQALLAIVAMPTAYGVGIGDHIEKRTGIEHADGSVYACLLRLHDKGFVLSLESESTPQRGGRRKVLYRITKPGRRAMAAALKAIDALRGRADLEIALVPA